ncbi:MAG: DNA recombination protein RmuC [Burkholderiales bacterium]|jgi:DNA recombination protein RmuC|nr:DNA recombination protein RmuC [Burkholderiales bacterium]
MDTLFYINIALVIMVAITLIFVVILSFRLAHALRETIGISTLLQSLFTQYDKLERDIHQDLATQRNELSTQLHQQAQVGEQKLATQLQSQQELWTRFEKQLSQLTLSSEQKLEAIRKSLEERLDLLRNDNAQKLEQMRVTVDEKLQSTLEARLGESFKQVADRLEQVYKGLGEMQNLAVGVGDLKRVLTNVKDRGTWGEVQLSALLADVLTPQQYDENVATIPGSNDRVEFAIRLPGRDADTVCRLPIDAKFPMENWRRLQEALENADKNAAEKERKQLETFIRNSAKTIREKYIASPHTTDFAILFVPTEGLYAEIMARRGLNEEIQRDLRVMLAGPNTLIAMLNSLQMGFRTLAIEQRSGEVWKVLAAVKTEFQKFGEVLAKTGERLDQAKSELDRLAGARTNTIRRALKSVETLPDQEAQRLLGPIDESI